jgi:hypothetical protein
VTSVEPPEDPDEWTDEQWIEWLSETDRDVVDAPAAPPKSWRHARTARGVYGAMLALHDVIYGEHDPEPAIVIEAAGDPPDPESVEVHLERDDPDESTVVVRPWLIDHDGDVR